MSCAVDVLIETCVLGRSEIDASALAFAGEGKNLFKTTLQYKRGPPALDPQLQLDRSSTLEELDTWELLVKMLRDGWRHEHPPLTRRRPQAFAHGGPKVWFTRANPDETVFKQYLRALFTEGKTSSGRLVEHFRAGAWYDSWLDGQVYQKTQRRKKTKAEAAARTSATGADENFSDDEFYY